jgi:serine/threonine-protein kinase RsbW
VGPAGNAAAVEPERALNGPLDEALPAEPRSVPAARRRVVDYAAAAGADADVMADVALAVSEVVSNVVLHAYLDRVPGRIRLCAERTDDELEIVVEDDGRGMLPRADSPGLGLGLALAGQVAERFDVHSEPGEGTRISLRFALGV